MFVSRGSLSELLQYSCFIFWPALAIGQQLALRSWGFFLCILANGLLATWEDEQPGGFNNPLPKKTGKGSDDE
jgi:hypothetical protein